MNKSKILISGVLLLLLVSCKPNTSESEQNSSSSSQGETSNSEVTDLFSEHKEILKSVTDFDVSSTSGFDYLLNQEVDGTITNSHEIALRVNRKNDIKARKHEKTIKLNSSFEDEQFTITEETSYYHNNKIGRLIEGNWSWISGELTNFTAVNIGNFNFDITKMANVSLGNSQENKELIFSVPSTQIVNVFGDKYDFKNVVFTIIFNPTLKTLVELDLTYNQEISKTVFNFAPIYGDVTVILP